MKFMNIFFLIAIVSVTACSAPIFGLKPLHPENTCRGGPNSKKLEIPFAEVDSLRPVLRWETFPPEGVRYDAEQIGKVRNITYDLNIWLSEHDSPSFLIYSRRGLPEPRHEMEQPLLPCADYFWTVRARFIIDGKERVSEWGVCARPWFWKDPSKIYDIDMASAEEIVRRSPVVPHPNLYRFMSPCPKKAEEPRERGIL